LLGKSFILTNLKRVIISASDTVKGSLIMKIGGALLGAYAGGWILLILGIACLVCTIVTCAIFIIVVCFGFGFLGAMFNN
jgi:hypothetical protein